MNASSRSHSARFAFRPNLNPLEDRVILSGTSGTPFDKTIASAVAGQTIYVDGPVTAARLDRVPNGVKIVGVGQNPTIILNNPHAALVVNGTSAISNLTITANRRLDGSALKSSRGQLTLSNVTVKGVTESGGCPLIYFEAGQVMADQVHLLDNVTVGSLLAVRGGNACHPGNWSFEWLTAIGNHCGANRPHAHGSSVIQVRLTKDSHLSMDLLDLGYNEISGNGSLNVSGNYGRRDVVIYDAAIAYNHNQSSGQSGGVWAASAHVSINLVRGFVQDNSPPNIGGQGSVVITSPVLPV